MRRVVLGLCLAGLLFPVPAERAHALDAGEFRGSYTYTGPGLDWDNYTFSRINFAGSLTAGTKTYTGEFHIDAGMTARGEDYECGSFGCLDLNGWFLPTRLYRFSWTAIRGTTNGHSLKGACQGGESSVDWPRRSFLFRCSVSVDGSKSKPVTIAGTTTDADMAPFAQGVGFAGPYTVGAK